MREVVMPSRNTIMSHMTTKFLLMKLNLKKELSKSSNVCLTTDIWTHRSRSFIGVSCHYIDSEWKRKSFILAFRRMSKRHTYDNLAIVLKRIIDEFDLDCHKIRHVVTDGGSNFCKAFRVFGRKEPDNCGLAIDFSTMWTPTGDNIASCDEEDIMILNEEEATDSIPEIENIFDIENASIESEQLDFEEEEILNTELSLPPQMRCFAHLLNLIGKFPR